MPLLRVRNGYFAHIEEKYALLRTHTSFARREKTEQLDGLFTGSGLRWMLERKNHYVMEMFISFIAQFISESVGLEGRCEPTEVILQYSDFFGKILVDHMDETLVEGKLMTLRSKIEDLKRVVERVFASRCQFGLYTFKSHHPDHLVEKLERIGSISLPDARSVESILTFSLSIHIE